LQHIADKEHVFELGTSQTVEGARSLSTPSRVAAPPGPGPRPAPSSSKRCNNSSVGEGEGVDFGAGLESETPLFHWSAEFPFAEAATGWGG
ncbi:unnamed protein product, partial [Laminaria digitata]